MDWKSMFHIKTEISQNEPMFHKTNRCFTRGHLGSPTFAGQSCHIPLGQSRNQFCTHPSPALLSCLVHTACLPQSSVPVGPDNPVIEAITIDEPHSSFSI